MSWVLAAIGFSLVIILHELGHFFVAKAVGMRVERFSLFFPPTLLRKKFGETEYALGMIPLGGYVRITGMSLNEEVPNDVAHRAYLQQPVWKRVAVIAAGPLVNLVLAFLVLSALFISQGEPVATTRIATVQAHEPASGILKSGDKILSIDGVHGTSQQLGQAIASHRCAGVQKAGCRAQTAAHVVVDRDHRVLRFDLKPLYDPSLRRTRLGFDYAIDHRPVAPLRSAQLSGSFMWFVTTTTVDKIAGIFHAKNRKQLGGVVGIYEYTRAAVEINLATTLQILALISLSLGILNLFPFLPLDGGHIFWAIAEKIRRRPISSAVIEKASFVGFALVLILFVIGLSNDIGRLTGPGFNLR